MAEKKGGVHTLGTCNSCQMADIPLNKVRRQDGKFSWLCDYCTRDDKNTKAAERQLKTENKHLGWWRAWAKFWS